MLDLVVSTCEFGFLGSGFFWVFAENHKLKIMGFLWLLFLSLAQWAEIWSGVYLFCSRNEVLEALKLNWVANYEVWWSCSKQLGLFSVLCWGLSLAGQVNWVTNLSHEVLCQRLLCFGLGEEDQVRMRRKSIVFCSETGFGWSFLRWFFYWFC